MLSPEENALFTSVRRGTRMGDMLRRYWHPVGCSQLLTSKPQRVTVLGEELVLFRGASGKPHLMQLRCAHRSLALDYGRVEGECIRCPYHGWLYDADGNCLEQPAEPEGSSFKDKIKMRAYKTQEVSGLIFGYLGPDPAPVLPLFDCLRVNEGTKYLQVQQIHANWFNHVENIVDVSHLAWLHGYTFPAYGARKVAYHWDRTSFGANNVMQMEGLEDTHISCYGFPNVNRFTSPPFKKGGALMRSMIWRVPEDDEKTLLYFIRIAPDGPTEMHTGRRDRKLGEYLPLENDWWGIDVSDQDRMAVEQQGVIADRPNEHLGVSDGGIILMRQMMRESLALIAQGNDPLYVIRDPAKQNIDFPVQATMTEQRQDDVGYHRGFIKDGTLVA